MLLRDARPDDLDVIVELIVLLAEFEEAADEVVLDRGELGGWIFGDDPRAWVTIAEVDGEVAGMALWHWTFSTWLGRPGIWLEDLVVRPEHRRRGLGRALIASLVERSPGRVEWSVLDWNEGAIALYDAVGAEAVGGWTRMRISPRP